MWENRKKTTADYLARFYLKYWISKNINTTVLLDHSKGASTFLTFDTTSKAVLTVFESLFCSITRKSKYWRLRWKQTLDHSVSLSTFCQLGTRFVYSCELKFKIYVHRLLEFSVFGESTLTPDHYLWVEYVIKLLLSL